MSDEWASGSGLTGAHSGSGTSVLGVVLLSELGGLQSQSAAVGALAAALWRGTAVAAEVKAALGERLGSAEVQAALAERLARRQRRQFAPVAADQAATYAVPANLTHLRPEDFGYGDADPAQAVVAVYAAGWNAIVAAARRSRPALRDLKAGLRWLTIPQPLADAVAAALGPLVQTAGPVAADTEVDLQWRVDVTISSAQSMRVLRPSLTMGLDQRTFAVPLDQFHALRFHVARMLTDMAEIRRHPVLQIAEKR